MRPFKAVTLSDLHLGNPRTTAEEMTKGLYAAFPDNAQTAELDLILIAGDITDYLLHLNNPAVIEIDLFFCHLFGLAAKYGIRVRLLEGTPRHDWKQARRLIELNTMAGINADVKYFSTIAIEYIEDLDINILYVPDEARDTASEVYAEVTALLKAKDLQQVDIACMHGQFDFQLADFIQDHVTHNSQAYLDLVKYLIFVGHVHTYMTFERIIGQGSFDRIAHGEPKPKGMVRWELFADGSFETEFVENKLAKQYVTVEAFGMNLTDLLKEVERVAGDLPHGSWVRLQAESVNPIFQNMEVLLSRYPFFTWTRDQVTPKKEGKEAEIEEAVIYVPPRIDADNVIDLIVERMIKMGATPEQVARARIVLKEVV